MEQYIPVVGYMDELFAVLSIPVFVFELKKNQFKLKIQKLLQKFKISVGVFNYALIIFYVI